MAVAMLFLQVCSLGFETNRRSLDPDPSVGGLRGSNNVAMA